MDTEHGTLKLVRGVLIALLCGSVALGTYLLFMSTVHVVDFSSCVEAGGQVSQGSEHLCTYGGNKYIQTSIETSEKGNKSEPILLVVHPRLEKCPSDETRRCLLVDEEVLESEIDGFEYSEGNYYKIIVERKPRSDAVEPLGREDYHYLFKQVVSLRHVFTPEPPKTPAIKKELPEAFVPIEEFVELSIGPFMVDCETGKSGACLLVDGEVANYKIDGYTHQSGVGTIIRAVRTQHYALGTAPEDVDTYSYRFESVID